MIGPSLNWELAQAGVYGGHYSIAADGTLTTYADTPASMISAVEAVLAAHDASKPDPYQIRAQAQAALDASDTTMHRIVEAVIAERTTLTAGDVVAWGPYRATLRAVVASPASVRTLPAHPPYPVGT